MIVAQPMRQHSGELAQALAEAGRLEAFLTLLPDERSFAWVPGPLRWLLPRSIFRNALPGLPRGKVRALIGPVLILKAGRLWKSRRVRSTCELLTWSLFDRWAAALVQRSRPKAVIGYEMCAVETFRVAKAQGAKCILDAAAFHYLVQDPVLSPDGENMDWVERTLRQRKRTEIELADLIVCCSDYARQSYLRAGVDPQRVVSNPMGADTAAFGPTETDSRVGGVKFLFAGTPSIRKGFDMLLEAFYPISERYPSAELHVAGDSAEAIRFLRRPMPAVTLHGKLSRRALAGLLSTMDCLVLPSLLDSFGMVVIEGLAAGVPVIVTTNVGAGQAIMPGQNGWIIPAASPDALFEQMARCCERPGQLRAMRHDCIVSAKPYDWRFYKERALKMIINAVEPEQVPGAIACPPR